MNLYKTGCLCCLVLSLSSCDPWYLRRPPVDPVMARERVWGSKPVYAALDQAKNIQFLAGAQPVVQAGNIYAFRNFIFQIDVGRGIHVIDHTDRTAARKIGFIRVNGCAQVSIRGSYLYTNSLTDLVTIDISDPTRLREVSRLRNTFPEFGYAYPLIQPDEQGFYECPRSDSVVVDWVKDSVYNSCYKS